MPGGVERTEATKCETPMELASSAIAQGEREANNPLLVFGLALKAILEGPVPGAGVATLQERILDELDDPDDCAHGHPSCRKCLFERRESLLREAADALDAKGAEIAAAAMLTTCHVQTMAEMDDKIKRLLGLIRDAHGTIQRFRNADFTKWKCLCADCETL